MAKSTKYLVYADAEITRIIEEARNKGFSVTGFIGNLVKGPGRKLIGEIK